MENDTGEKDEPVSIDYKKARGNPAYVDSYDDEW